MIKKLIVVLGLLACAPGAMAQQVKQFNQYIQGLPSATLPLSPGDELYVLQGGISKHVPQSGISGGGGGGASNTTRAMIPTLSLTGASNFILTGYATANDLGFGAPYTCVGQTSASILAIQDNGGNWCGLNLSATNVVNPGWFGAKADDGATTISAGDIAANPQWRGIYSAGTTWDTVGTQEAKYAAYAGKATAGSMPNASTWNAGVGNLTFYVPNGTFGLNRQIYTHQQGFIDWFAGRGQAIWDWKGDPTVIMWLCDSCSYGEMYNLSVETSAASTDYGLQVPLVSLDNLGSVSPFFSSGLKTQQLTLYDMFCSVGFNGQCIEISRRGAGAQGDTVTFINPVWLGFASDAALIIGGDNALSETIIRGDCQGFWAGACIRNSGGGSVLVYGMTFENQNNDSVNLSPVLGQIQAYGADVDMQGGVSAEISVINGSRSEGEILMKNDGGSPIDVVSGEVIGTTLLDWFANFGGELPGATIRPSANNTKGRTFIAVDTGAMLQWRTPTSTSGEVITDSTASFTVNQFAGMTLQWRFGGSGFTFHCTNAVLSNTATSITLDPSCNSGTLPVANAGSRYLITTSTGAVAPNFDSAAAGGKTGLPGNIGQGFFTSAGSNLIAVGNDYSSISVNDYIIIPNADQLGVSGSGGIMPAPLIAQVTMKNGPPCAWTSGLPSTSCLTVTKNAAYTLGSAGSGGAFGYYGTAITDNTTLKWVAIDWQPVSGMRLLQGFAGANLGPIGAQRAIEITGVANAKLEGLTLQQNVLQTALDVQARINAMCSLTPSSTIDLTSCMQASNNASLVPAQNETLNAPLPVVSTAPTATIAQDFALHITTSGTTPRTLTFGTNFDANGPLNTGAKDSVNIDVLFRSNGTVWKEISRSPSPAYQTLVPGTLYSAAGTALPSCAVAATTGTLAVVSDAVTPTYAGAYTSGGTFTTPVFCNGTAWVTH